MLLLHRQSPDAVRSGSLTVPAGEHVVADPYDKVLKYSQAIVDYQAWEKAQRAKD